MQKLSALKRRFSFKRRSEAAIYFAVEAVFKKEKQAF